jgi:hypothetical protein
MADQHEVSHGDIYHKLGALEGKLDAVMSSVSEKRSDLAEAFRRLTELEKRVAQGVILAVLIATIAPLIWQALERKPAHSPAAVLTHGR